MGHGWRARRAFDSRGESQDSWIELSCQPPSKPQNTTQIRGHASGAGAMTRRRAGWAPHAAAAALAVVVLALVAPHAWEDLSQPNHCDTTYIRPRYAGVPLPAALAAAHPRYSLIRYADADPAVAKAAAGGCGCVNLQRTSHR